MTAKMVLHPDTAFDQIMVDDPSGGEHGIILLNRGGTIRAYLNNCPHIGVGLDYGDGDCLDRETDELVCSLHGARFSPDSGECLIGPCGGQFLTPFNVDVDEQGQVVCEA